MSDASKRPSAGRPAVDLEIYLGTLITENERLAELERYKVSRVLRAIHDFRGSLTMMNLHLYMMEHVPPDKHERHIVGLKDSIVDMVNQVEDLMVQMRQSDVPDDYVPTDHTHLDEF